MRTKSYFSVLRHFSLTKTYSVILSSLLTIHKNLARLTNAIETDIVWTKYKHRECPCRTKTSHCHHQYVCSVHLKASYKFEPTATIALIIFWEQILSQIEWIEIVFVDVAVCIRSIGDKSISSSLSYGHLYSFIVFDKIIAASTWIHLAIFGQRRWVDWLNHCWSVYSTKKQQWNMMLAVDQ